MPDEKAKLFKVQYLYGGMYVDAAGLSVNVDAHYPRRSVDLPCATATERRGDGSACK